MGNSDFAEGAATQTATGAATDLAAVVDAWPDLPAALRAGIVAMIRATMAQGAPDTGTAHRTTPTARTPRRGTGKAGRGGQR